MQKICLFHRNQFHADIFPKLAKVLEKNYGFFVEQITSRDQENAFFTLQYEEEIYSKWDEIDITPENLLQISKRYSVVDFQRLIFADRDFNFFPKYLGQKRQSQEFQLKYLIGCINTFERFLKSSQPDMVVSDLTIGIPDIFSAVCKLQNIKYISLRSSKLVPGTIVCNSEFDIPVGLIDIANEHVQHGAPADVSEIAKSHISEIKRKIRLPDYMEASKQPFKLFTVRRLTNFVRSFKRRRKNVTPVSPERNPNLRSIRWNISKWLNVIITSTIRNLIYTNEKSLPARYFLFTLQYEPENSTAIRSFPYSDQIDTIRLVAKALPLGVTLLVKEHAGNQGYRKPKDYRELLYIPNVALVDSHVSVNFLINNCLGIITFTSRLGWEAILSNKPVIAFGKTFYTHIKGVHRFESWIKLQQNLLSILLLSSGSQANYDEQEIYGIATAYISLSFDGTYLDKVDKSNTTENIGKLASIIYSQVQS